MTRPNACGQPEEQNDDSFLAAPFPTAGLGNVPCAAASCRAIDPTCARVRPRVPQGPTAKPAMFLLTKSLGLGIIQFCARVAERQTRRSQKPLSKDVRVQIPPRAPVETKGSPSRWAFLLPARSKPKVPLTYPRRGLGHQPLGDSRYPARFARAVAASCIGRRFASRTVQEVPSENPSRRCPNPRRCAAGAEWAIFRPGPGSAGRI